MKMFFYLKIKYIGMARTSRMFNIQINLSLVGSIKYTMKIY
jgi:hypothetical protein